MKPFNKFFFLLAMIIAPTTMTAQNSNNAFPDFILKFDNQTVEISPSLESYNRTELKVVKYSLTKTQTICIETFKEGDVALPDGPVGKDCFVKDGRLLKVETVSTLAHFDADYCKDIINVMKDIRNLVKKDKTVRIAKALGDFICIGIGGNEGTMRILYGGVSLVIPIDNADDIIDAFEKSLQAIS